MGDRLAGKTAIVIGGGQLPGRNPGNGRATALRFAGEGAEIMVVDRNGDAAEATVTEIRKNGGEAFAHVADIVSEKDNVRIATTARDRWGRIDVLHNNVGTQMNDGWNLDLEEAAWRRIIDLNLTAMWLTCKHVVPVMREKGSGAIVNISSIGAVTGPARSLAYGVSKAGVNALTHALANDNAPHGIRVNAIMPGLIDTPMAVDQIAEHTGRPRDEIAAERERRVPMGRMGSAWDVANAALFLASDEAGFVTGVVLPVDGGHTAAS